MVCKVEEINQFRENQTVAILSIPDIAIVETIHIRLELVVVPVHVSNERKYV